MQFGGITDEMTIYKHVLKKKKTTVSPTLSVSVVVRFILFLLCRKTRNQKQMSMVRKYHNQTLQTKTRPDIIMHFIKQRNQFHFECKLYAQKCASVSVGLSFVPNVVVQHVSSFVASCIEVTHYKWRVRIPSYLWVMWHMMLISVYAISVILWGTVTGHSSSPYFNVAV